MYHKLNHIKSRRRNSDGTAMHTVCSSLQVICCTLYEFLEWILYHAVLSITITAHNELVTVMHYSELVTIIYESS